MFHGRRQQRSRCSEHHSRAKKFSESLASTPKFTARLGINHRRTGDRDDTGKSPEQCEILRNRLTRKNPPRPSSHHDQEHESAECDPLPAEPRIAPAQERPPRL